MQTYDVAIVGGGMIGLSAALAMAQNGLSVAIIEAEAGDRALGPEPELRVSAINLASQQFLKNLGVWSEIESERLLPYQDMQVWEQDSFAEIAFDHQQILQPQLGFIIENQLIRRCLWAKAQADEHIDLKVPCKIQKLAHGHSETFVHLDDDSMLTAKLVVGADGANSWVRKQAGLPITFWDYGHQAIVATIQTQEPHGNCARQVFTPAGPLAFLPLWQDNLCSIVWSQTSDQAQHLLALDKTAFSRELTVAFDNRLGPCELVSERQSYPLKMRYARKWVKDRVALIGDAAHSIHPLAGQGANLGFMDAAALAQTLSELKQQNLDIGEAANLRHFERWRKAEAVKMIAAMEGFKRLFAGDNPVKKLIRGLGLAGTNQLLPAKQLIMRQATGLEGELPKLAQTHL